MRWIGRMHALAATLTAETILLSASVVFLGTFTIYRAPILDWQMIVRGRELLDVSNGSQCLPLLPMLACASAMTRTEFKITYPTRDGTIVLMAIVPPH